MTTDIESVDDSQLVNKGDIAKMLKVSNRTVENLVKARKIPIIRITPRCVRFSKLAVLMAMDRFSVDAV